MNQLVDQQLTPEQLWQTIRAEAQAFALKEPTLAGHLHASVLSHDALSVAMAYTLAEQLGDNLVSSLSLLQVLDAVFRADLVLQDRMCRDFMAHVERDPACHQYCYPLLYFKGFHALQTHRAAHYLWHQGRRAMAVYLQSRSTEVFMVDIHPAADIGGGVMLDHATGIVIGETARVGNNVSMLHSVSLGGSGSQGGIRHPQLGDGVLIAAGAKLLGNIVVGDGVKVGAGSLLLSDVPANTTVVGVPAIAVGSGSAVTNSENTAISANASI